MAHLFQEKLETDGKTNVSMWQLDMHFERYADDPVGALKNCQRLRHSSEDRTPAERQGAIHDNIWLPSAHWLGEIRF